jgi:hypothetical protein
MTILFRDDFTGDGSFYGRSPDGENCFSLDAVWSEEQDKASTQGGYIRSSATWNDYEVWISLSDWGGTAEYIDENNDPQTLDISSDAHEVHVRVTRMSSEDSIAEILWKDGNGGSIGSVIAGVDEVIGVPVDVLIEIPVDSGVGRYSIRFAPGTGIDYFIITTPGHVFDPENPPAPPVIPETFWVNVRNAEVT